MRMYLLECALLSFATGLFIACCYMEPDFARFLFIDAPAALISHLL